MSFIESLVEPLLKWRDRLLVNPDFQRRSLRLPFARRVARRRIRALFDLCSGFVYSQVLLTCVRLNLFEAMAETPRSADELAERLALPRASLDRLLEAAESLELIEARGKNRFGLGPLGAALLGNPAVQSMIEHHSALYADLSDPVALLRGEQETTELGRYWAYSKNAGQADLSSRQTADYTDLMADSQALIADHVLSSYPVDRHRRLLDVGGGAGAFIEAALSTSDRLEARVFDLPSVAERARARFERLGLDARASASGGDFLNDELPGGYDLVSLVRILHDHDDDAVRSLLTSIRRSIDEDGTLLIAEPLLNTRGAEPITAAYFGFYLLAMGQGRARSADTLRGFLNDAGFGQIKERRTPAPLLVRVLTARPR